MLSIPWGIVGQMGVAVVAEILAHLVGLSLDFLEGHLGSVSRTMRTIDDPIGTISDFSDFSTDFSLVFAIFLSAINYKVSKVGILVKSQISMGNSLKKLECRNTTPAEGAKRFY